METVSTLISALALILALFVFFQDRSRSRQQAELSQDQAEIAKRLAEIEQDRRQDELISRKRADLSVRLLARPTTSTHRYTYHWVISNTGEAEAHNVYFQAESTKEGHSGKLAYRRDEVFPVRKISANQNFEFHAYPKQVPPPFEVQLRWTDDEGSHTSESVVSLEYAT